MRGGLLSGLLAACIQTNSVICTDGRLCPAGASCRQIANPDARGGITLTDVCATAAQLATCDDQAQGDPCTLAGATRPVCEDGVCIDAVCGNGLLDPGEQCDDGNTIDGDGCSSDCQAEMPSAPTSKS